MVTGKLDSAIPVKKWDVLVAMQYDGGFNVEKEALDKLSGILIGVYWLWIVSKNLLTTRWIQRSEPDGCFCTGWFFLFSLLVAEYLLL